MKRKLKILATVFAGFVIGCAVGLDNTVGALKASGNFVISAAETVVDTAKSLINTQEEDK